MTLDDFFTALEKTPRDWGLISGAIRRRAAYSVQCPLTAVAGFGQRLDFWTHAGPAFWRDAAKTIELSAKDVQKILSAADGRGQLRGRLLTACGMRPAPEKAP
jgi:hypothetical protein